MGHIQRNCEKKKAQMANNSSDKDKQKEEQSASFCLSDQTQKLSIGDFCPEFALHVQVEPPKDSVESERKTNEKWFLDSACSNHMTGHKSDLANFVLFDTNKPRFVELADKSLVRAVGCGDLNVYLPDRHGKSVPIVFKEVMFVPKLRKRLISIGQLTKRGAQVTFNSDSVNLRIGGRNFLFGCSYGNLYNMNCSVVASCNFAGMGSASHASEIDELQKHSTSVGEFVSEINFGSGSISFEGVNDDAKLETHKSCNDGNGDVQIQNCNNIADDQNSTYQFCWWC